MANMNHSRPALKFIDNLRREVNRGSEAYKYTEKAKSLASKRPRITFWDKMQAVGLSTEEESGLLELFELNTKLMDTALEMIKLRGRGQKDKKSNLQAREGISDDIMVKISVVANKLIYLNLEAFHRERKNSIFDWLELLKPKLKRDGLIDLYLSVQDALHKSEEFYSAYLEKTYPSK